MLLILKAVDRHDTHTMALFMAPTVVNAYSKKDGTSVAPHVAMRRHALPHPTMDSYSKKSNNAAVDNTGAVMNQAELVGIPAAVASLTPGIEDDGHDIPLPPPRPNVRDVPEHMLGAVMAHIEKANRRAIKLGVEGFRVELGQPFDKRVRNFLGTAFDGPEYGPWYLVRTIPVTIEGPSIKAPGGWELQGRVDFEDGSTIVNAKPGVELPPRYRSASGACDHCKADRQRNAIFVFKDPKDDYMQVGRSCLRDFFNRDPADALWAASEFGGIFDEIDDMLDRDERGGGSSRSRVVRVDEVMEAAAAAVRQWGFTSRAKANDFGGAATADAVSYLLFDKKVKPEERPLPEDGAKGKAVIDWVQAEWGGKADKSDYEYNAVELTGKESVRPQRVGILASLVAAYNRANEEQVARAKRVNEWVGEVGQRREFEATFAGSNSFETQFGIMFVMRFDSPEGLLVYKGGTPDWAVDANGGKTLQVGDVIKFVGTIKAHDDYKGTKQTLVSRCALPKEKPVKVPKAKKVAAEAVA